MKVFNLIEIKKVEKAVEPEKKETWQGDLPEDKKESETKPEKKHTGKGKKILAGIGAVGAIAGGVLVIAGKLASGRNGSDEDTSGDPAAEIPFEDTTDCDTGYDFTEEPVDAE